MPKKSDITEIFDLEPIKQQKQELIKVNQKLTEIVKTTKKGFNDNETLESQIYEDYIKSRDNFDNILESGSTALEKVLDIAEQGQHPRFFEAAALLLKTLSEANKEYMEIHLKMVQIKKTKAEISGNISPDLGNSVTVDKAIFIGSTKDLLNQIKPRIVVEPESQDL